MEFKCGKKERAGPISLTFLWEKECLEKEDKV
jgi:hypothetical protein